MIALEKQSIRHRCLIAMVLWFVSSAARVGAVEGSITAGVLIEQNFYLSPGVRVTAESPALLNGHPQAMLSYTTSRAALWNGPNDLAIDDILLCCSWHFKPKRPLDPFVGIDVGYLRFDREDDDKFALLPNAFARCNLRVGVRSCLWQGRLLPAIEAGYVILQNSVTFPLFYTLSVGYEIAKGAR